MKRLCLLVLVSATFVPAQAQLALVPYGGYDFRTGNPLVGVGVEIGVLSADVFEGGLSFRPSAEYFHSPQETRGGLTLDRQRYQLNGDFIAKLTSPLPLGVFVGLGLGYHYSSVSQYDLTITDSDLGLNLLAGADAEFRSLQPFLQGRLRRDQGVSLFAVMGGIKVGL